MGNHPSTGAPGAAGTAGAREIGKAESVRTGEPLEAFRKEKERDDHLKNLGFKRSKSLRKSISKRLKRHKKHEDIVDVGPNESNRPDPDPSTTAAVELSSTASKPKRSSSNERIERIDPPRRRPLVGEPQPLPTHVQDSLDDQHRPRRMDRLRKSLRSSIRKKKHRDEADGDPAGASATAQPKSASGGSGGSGKPQLWSNDEAAVRSGTCSFHVKYLGCVEVFESRGMQVCEEAIKVLKASKRKSVRAIFYVHGDGLRVVDAETKGLIVDQTIEKVSFCAPDRNFEKGFSYICRDGTTRRWMCHGFMSNRDSGERLSHAVGCAFAICLERKQKRDKECSVTMTYDSSNSSFTRFGSFRQATITERLQDPQGFKAGAAAVPKKSEPAPEDKQFAIARPHATDIMLQRQTSFRGFGQLGGNSPFKRNLSLRLSDLPSNLERQRTNPLAGGTDKPSVSPIPEGQPTTKEENISDMCQQLSHGLSLLNAQDFQNHDFQLEQPQSLPPLRPSVSPLPPVPEHDAASPILLQPAKPDPLANVKPVQYDNPWDFVPDQTKYSAPQVPKPSSTSNNCDSSSGVSSSASTSNGGVASAQTPADDWLTANGVFSNDGKKSPNHSLGSSSSKEWNAEFWSKDPFDTSAAILDDPFDAEWAALATRNNSRNDIQSPTNPFKESAMKAFELQM